MNKVTYVLVNKETNEIVWLDFIANSSPDLSKWTVLGTIR